MRTKLEEMGGRGAFKNEVRLDQHSLELLAEDFGLLDGLSAGIAERAVRYVLEEDGEAVLADLPKLNNGAEVFKLLCTNQYYFANAVTPRSEFFKTLNCAVPEFFIRLGHVYEAIAHSSRNVGLFHSFGDPKLDWLEILLCEAFRVAGNIWPKSAVSCPALSAEMVEEMLKARGHPAELLVRTAFFLPSLQRFTGLRLEPVFGQMVGIEQSAIRHKPPVLEALTHRDVQQRLHALRLMREMGVPPGEFLEPLVDMAVGSSKQARELAEPLLAQVKDAAAPLLEQKLQKGEKEERAATVRVLWIWDSAKARPLVAARLGVEKNKKVLGVIQELLGAGDREKPVESSAELALPPLAPIPDHLPLGAETKQAWEDCCAQLNAAIEKILANNQAPRNPNLDTIPDAEIAAGFAMMQGGVEVTPVLRSINLIIFQEPLARFWQRPELQLIHLIRFLMAIGDLRSRETYRSHYGNAHWLGVLLPFFRRARPETGLRELGAAFDAAGLEARGLGERLLESYFEVAVPFGLPPSHVWPYWAENLDLLETAFKPGGGDFLSRLRQQHRRRNAFHALGTFPQPPARLLPLLWDLALGPKSERSQARQCLAGLPDKAERLIHSLSSGNAETRLAAAEWLGRLGERRATEPLLEAFQREKNEPAKGALMNALEQLGVPLDQFLNRKALLQEAEKGTAKGLPEPLQWFPCERMPAVHWADNGQRVETAILHWWLAQSFKLKNPVPGTLLRRYCAGIKTDEREALGQFVLEAWMAQDITPLSGAAAEQEAMKRAQAAVQATQQWVQWLQHNPQMAQQVTQHFGPQSKTLQEYYEQILPQVQRDPTGSAVASKGVLALAGACAGAGVVPLISHYLKEWYGLRAAQCRALLQMLAWVEHRSATQLLLAVGSRFRTKSIQEEATHQAQALADRKGWTVAELADRTIPSAGLDEHGALAFDYGPRQFTAQLNDDIEFVLTDGDGKLLKALPEPRKDDVEPKAQEAKKLFAAAKKELKSVLAMQRERLYEAMCTQRMWPFEEWSLYLHRHPVMRYYCRRLVWAVVRDGKVARLFRPLADGSLTDAADEAVIVGAEDPVSLAHECLVRPEQSQAWRGHLGDYEIEPLFEQFGRAKFSLTEERQHEIEMRDFEGHVVEAFKLRGRATKLGYTRGQPQDGGWFYDYRKRFPTLSVEAVIEFSGNSLPEENRTVALTRLLFNRLSPEDGSAASQAELELAEVRAVLLSECWNDLRQIAAEGTGFDPEWEQKTCH